MFTKVYCIYIHVFQEAVKVAIQTRLFDWPSICSFGRYPKETICGLELGFFSFIFIIIFFHSKGKITAFEFYTNFRRPMTVVDSE